MSKGGTKSGSTEIPAWLENAAIENINKARDVSQIGYVPYYGPDVAAFSPMQQQSMLSTGNAASAFGLAPQGFDAMAGMPQAETFAGGVQGYSSAPLYEQSLDKLFANAPAQYRALNQQFIDPFTGAAPRNAYNATPMQSSQMMSGGGGGNEGFVDQAHADRMAQMSSTGRHYGVNSQYNPYATANIGEITEDISGDGVIDYRDMSFGEDGRRQIGNVEKYGNMFLGGIPRIIDGVQGSLFDFMGKGDSGMTPEQSMQIINDGAARYNRLRTDRGFDPNSLSNELMDMGTTPLASSNITASYPNQDRDRELAMRMAEEISMANARKQADFIASENALKQAMQAEQDRQAQLKIGRNLAVQRQAASPTVAALRSTVNDGPQWSPSVNSSDASAPKASYSSTGKNGYNFGL